MPLGCLMRRILSLCLLLEDYLLFSAMLDHDIQSLTVIRHFHQDRKIVIIIADSVYIYIYMYKFLNQRLECQLYSKISNYIGSWYVLELITLFLIITFNPHIYIFNLLKSSLCYCAVWYSVRYSAIWTTKWKGRLPFSDVDLDNYYGITWIIIEPKEFLLWIW